jgi:hypothetical protein
MSLHDIPTVNPCWRGQVQAGLLNKVSISNDARVCRRGRNFGKHEHTRHLHDISRRRYDFAMIPGALSRNLFLYLSWVFGTGNRPLSLNRHVDVYNQSLPKDLVVTCADGSEQNIDMGATLFHFDVDPTPYQGLGRQYISIDHL